MKFVFLSFLILFYLKIDRSSFIRKDTCKNQFCKENSCKYIFNDGTVLDANYYESDSDINKTLIFILTNDFYSATEDKEIVKNKFKIFTKNVITKYFISSNEYTYLISNYDNGNLNSLNSKYFFFGQSKYYDEVYISTHELTFNKFVVEISFKKYK